MSTTATAIRTGGIPMDKENAADIFSSAKKTSKGGGLGNFNSIIVNDGCSTPVTNIASTTKRRALGDVINTTTSKTANNNNLKHNRHSMIYNDPSCQAMKGGTTPAIFSSKKSTKPVLPPTQVKRNLMMKSTSIDSPLRKLALLDIDNDIEQQEEITEEFPPVEKFYAPPPDTFDDLFEESGGRLTDVFLAHNGSCVTSTIGGCFVDHDDDEMMKSDNDSTLDFSIHNDDDDEDYENNNSYENKEIDMLEQPNADALHFKMPEILI